VDEERGAQDAVVKPGYKSFYVYSAVYPATGEDMTVFLPWVDTDTMNSFLGRMEGKLLPPGRGSCGLARVQGPARAE